MSVSTIYGKTTATNLTSTASTAILSNAAASSKAFKVNTLNVANTTTTAANVSVSWYTAAAIGGTAFPLAGTISVPGNSTLNVIDKGSLLYLEENQSLGATAGTANALIVTCSYEDIS
ncbi:MAG: hypothetical protein EBV07_01615 [Proteobacteria bacterium]|nr:hypothetical protein [Pseudomonadota bacterium]